MLERQVKANIWIRLSILPAIVKLRSTFGVYAIRCCISRHNLGGQCISLDKHDLMALHSRIVASGARLNDTEMWLIGVLPVTLEVE